MIQRFRKLFLPLVLTTGILAGCASNADSNKAEEASTLKVMYHDERSFYQQYGMLFTALHPNVEIEVISTQNVRPEEGQDYEKMMMDYIEEQKPDVIMVGVDQYEELAADGKLVELDPFIEKDKFDLEGILPGVVEYLKEKGNGSLYGLTPEFYSQAIFYNKDLFDRYNIEYPRDKMTWEELLHLASLFPTDGTGKDRIYGLKAGYQTSLFELGNTIGLANDLNFVDPNSLQVTINTDSWKSIFESALMAIKSGTLYTEDPNSMNGNFNTYEDYLMRDPFISGRVAMMLEGTYKLNEIKEATASLKDKAVTNWDLVTVPVNPQTPDQSTYVNFYNIFAIHASAENRDAAWDFIKYIHGDDYARVAAKANTGNFPIRTKYIKDDEGRNLAAFYALKPAQPQMYRNYDKLPEMFTSEFYQLANEEMKAAEDGSKSVSEALDSLQNKLDKLMLEAKQKEDAGAVDAEQEAGGGAEAGSTDAAVEEESAPEAAE